MQEVWDLLVVDTASNSSKESSEQLLLALSHNARMGSSGHQTIRFHGTIHGKLIVTLVDSRSSASFLATVMADELPHLPCSAIKASVKIANGQVLQCTSSILGCLSLEEYQFKHDLRILQLDSYDLILGMDWLELYSPMQIH